MIDFNKVVWSYSRLKAYYNCKYAWKTTYIEGNRGEGNFLAASGSLMHQVLEDYANGEIYLWDLTDHYDALYKDFIKYKAPYNKYVDLEEKRKNTAHDYLDNFVGFEEIGEVVDVEKEIHITLPDGSKMVGYIDLLLREEGDYIILDHKSASNIKKNEHDEYFKQLYVYAKAIYDEFGVYPKRLILNQFNLGKLLIEEFDEEKYHHAIEWCVNTIAAIKKETEWETPNIDYYFCTNLCNHGKTCVYKNK
ncbi:MAG: PD-(D/E)XK nuclease family protein [Niameybacter sp.]